MPGRCRKIFSAKTELVGRVSRRGAHRRCDSLYGIERTEIVYSRRKDHRIENGIRRFKKIAGQTESASVLQRNPERFSGAGRRLGRGVDGCIGRFTGRNGCQSFRRETGMGGSTQLFQRLGSQSTATEGRNAVAGG